MFASGFPACLTRRQKKGKINSNDVFGFAFRFLGETPHRVRGRPYVRGVRPVFPEAIRLAGADRLFCCVSGDEFG